MSRISTETMTFGILALLFGLGGAYLARLYLTDEPEAEAPPPPQRETVPLAAMDLPAGKRIMMGDIVLKQMTGEEMTNQNIPVDRAMLNPQQIIGRRLRTPIRQLQPFLTDGLYPDGTRPSLSEKIKPGLRAVTVPINGANAVAGFAGPGSIVDVLFRTNSFLDERPGRVDVPDVTMVLLESVEVLALGGYTTPGEIIEADPADLNTVTLAVTPDQAARLVVAQGRGELSLSLRDPTEITSAGGVGQRPSVSSFRELLGLTPDPGPWITEHYVRGDGSVREFRREDIAEPEEESFGDGGALGSPIVPPGRAPGSGGGSGGR